MAATDPQRDWTYDVTDRLEAVVSVVRDKTAKPVTRAARAIVYGFIVTVLLTVVVTFFVLVVLRMLDAYIPVHNEARRVWIGDMIAAAIFLGAGAFLWRLRRPRSV